MGPALWGRVRRDTPDPGLSAPEGFWIPQERYRETHRLREMHVRPDAGGELTGRSR
jgi:hypothetical protein